MEEGVERIVLYDEEDRACRFEVLAVLDVEDGRYAVLLPEDSNGDDDEAYILRMEQDENGESILIGVDDDEELSTVVEAYEEMAKQYNN